MTITNGYAALGTVAAACRVRESDADLIPLLELATEAASRAIDDWCGREFFQTAAQARLYYPSGLNYVRTDDISETGSLAVKVDGDGDGIYETTLTDYVLWPLNAIVRAEPARRINLVSSWWPIQARERPSIQITAKWGWTAIPGPIQQATVIYASRLFKRKDSPDGIAGVADIGVLRISQTDADVVRLIARYRVPKL